MYSIYVEEADLARTEGDQTLANRFLESGIPYGFTVDGASVVNKATV
jgi:hypothetical protein